MDITPELAQDLMREWTPARLERISAAVAHGEAVQIARGVWAPPGVSVVALDEI